MNEIIKINLRVYEKQSRARQQWCIVSYEQEGDNVTLIDVFGKVWRVKPLSFNVHENLFVRPYQWVYNGDFSKPLGFKVYLTELGNDGIKKYLPNETIYFK